MDHQVNVFEAINGSVRRLSHIGRYSSIPTLRRENVAEHSFYAGIYGQIIGLDLRARGYDVDLGKLAMKCIWHDFAEALTGDMPRHFKYYDEEFRQQVGRVENRLVEESAKEFGWLNDDILKEWVDAKDQSMEGWILGFVDLLCVIAYCREEAAMGNQLIDQILEGNHLIMKERYQGHDLFGHYYDQLYPTDDYRDLYRSMPSNWERISAKR